ncbi:MAG TPA: hypothetical protein VEB19_10800 [Gemmatimonadaceae bacterium]|nr:hypothetical protein [Gemmatimonadaceae bacterium]
MSCQEGVPGPAVAGAAALATAGVVIVGRSRGTNPSVVGAAIGSIAGSVAAVGLDYLIRREMRAEQGLATATFTVSLSQGLLAAATSRLFSNMRRTSH